MENHFNSVEEIDQWIDDKPLALLYIFGERCSVCHGLQPQVQNVIERYPKVEMKQVNVNKVPDVAGRFSIFTVPVVLLFVDGKEYVREARVVPMEPFEEKINKIYTNYLG
ncbi:thiol reductase thioredoxin [Halalkalibacillus sediminis]|uniref:Thiol reductase thioredoxin n=1 Tax=Halalkalibacillus sediminis TaxID=2018042 RepID=A0A2I0QSE0_9BACI|nr:thioredoxin family protein [Halalkalibacillus sediminis]PKR77262.1 thiol reductase thioredoxin [Halalkalibacillus sediminis]